MGGQTDLKGREHLATKIDISFFVGNEVLNIFYLAIFWKKTIFFKINAKKILQRMTIFEGTVHRTAKMYMIFSVLNNVQNTVFKFFLIKLHAG